MAPPKATVDDMFPFARSFRETGNHSASHEHEGYSSVSLWVTVVHRGVGCWIQSGRDLERDSIA